MLRMRKRLLCGVAMVSLIAGHAALAQNMPAIAPPTWAGFYVGGHGGYSWGSVNGAMTHDVVIPAGNFPVFGFNNVGSVPFPGIARDVKPTGPLGGLQAGYNVQSGRVVYGFETDISWTGQRDTFNFNGTRFLGGEDYVYQETLRTQLQYMGTVRGRWGYTYGQFLPYATGGFAWGRMKADLDWSLHELFGATATFSGSQSRTLVGFTLGAGFEYAFAPKWSAKAEYLFVNLGQENFFSGVQGGGPFGLRDHILRVGVNYHP